MTNRPITTEEKLAFYAIVREKIGRNCAVRIQGSEVHAWGIPRGTNGPPQWCYEGQISYFLTNGATCA